MRIKALIFDVDGTLADTEEAHRTAFNQAFEHHGLDWNWSRLLYAQLLKTAGGQERLGVYVDSLELGPIEHRLLKERIPAIHKSKTEHYTRLIQSGSVPLREGVARLLDEASSAGVRLAIASTTTRANIDALIASNLGRTGMRRFSAVGAGEQTQRKKPAPDIYEWVLGQLCESAADCVAIEDSAHGLTAAKRAGLFTLITPTRWTCAEDFSDADLVVPSLGSCDRPLVELQYEFSTKRALRSGLVSSALGEA
jgi:HAD superfamily hydrolase (TIGR01509 family)